jgi:hypothetical protein
MIPSCELKAELEEFEKYHNKALDWYFKSLTFKWRSDEWMICRLKYKIYRRKAFSFAKQIWTN